MAKIKDRSKTYVIQCVICGTTSSIDRKIMHELHREIYNELQFEVDYSSLTLKGHCKRCRK